MCSMLDLRKEIGKAVKHVPAFADSQHKCFLLSYQLPEHQHATINFLLVS